MKTIIRRRLRQIRSVGPSAAALYAMDRLWRKAGNVSHRCAACVQATGLRTWRDEGPPRRIVPALSIPMDGAEADWCGHTFDLLGSGRRCLGLSLGEPASDLPRPWRSNYRRLFALLPRGYELIDWQVDARSGHRWSARQWHRDIAYGHIVGVDVKWPWELARLQHLPALAARLNTAPSDRRQAFECEIRAQIIDFVMQNPPGFGVNWACAMDVGIRATNLALAVDLARAAGTEFDEDFLSLVSATLRDHGEFLVRNLEWSVALCSNHYLANVVGLLYIAAYLPGEGQALDWLAFAGRETVLQLRRQFDSDGVNFEASTCYHRLSSEMMVYGAALMLNLAKSRRGDVGGWWSGTVPHYHSDPQAPALDAIRELPSNPNPFAAPDLRRLAGMGRFTQSLLRSNGSIPQIGDNDNGRFIRLGYGLDPYADLGSHAHLPEAVDALFGGSSRGNESSESAWLGTWIGNSALTRPSNLQDANGAFLAFPSFGLYVWNRRRFRLTLRCGSVGQNGNGGHSHADQLSITLDVGGRALVVDPGTGVYTADPEMRNFLRSAAVHSTIVNRGRELDSWPPGTRGLFSMEAAPKTRVIEVGPDGISAEHGNAEVTLRRNVRVAEAFVEINDEVLEGAGEFFAQLVLAEGTKCSIDNGTCHLSAPAEDASVVLHTTGGGFGISSVPISPHYGLIGKAEAICWRPGMLRMTLG